MIRTPDAPNTIVDTPHRLRDLLQLLSAGIPQQHCLLQHLLLLQVLDADGLLPAVDVGAADNGVFAWSWRHGDFDLGIGACKGGKVGAEE